MKINLNGANLNGGRGLRVAVWIASVAMIALSGCYILSPSQQSVDKLQTQMHFNLAQCQQIGANLYKCPGVDRSICGAFYSGEQVDCVKLDNDGNVIVQRQ